MIKIPAENAVIYYRDTSDWTQKHTVYTFDYVAEPDIDTSNGVKTRVKFYIYEKEYFVKVDHKVTDSFIDKMGKGVPVLDTVTKPCKVWKEDDFSFHIVLTQGLNRQIRRMCEYFGYRVVYLRRDRVMNITLEGLKKGRYRHLSEKEVAVLKKQLSDKFC